jgi:hypothetical protein
MVTELGMVTEMKMERGIGMEFERAQATRYPK